MSEKAELSCQDVSVPSADRVRPTTSIRCAGRALPDGLGVALRELATRSGVAPSSVVLAGFAVVLRRYGGLDRFAVAVVPPGCGDPPGDPLAVPFDLSADPGLETVLGRAHDAVLAGTASPRWDLAIGVTEGAAGHGPAGLTLRYARDRYEPATVGRLLDSVVHVLGQVCSDPAVPLGSLDVLPDDHRDLVVRRWNDTAAPYPADTCLHELFEQWAARTPDATAVVDAEGNAVSYRELDARANAVAHHLRGLGVRVESFVGICVDHSVEMLVGLFGILKAGGAYVPLDPEHPAERLGFMLADTGADVVVTLDRFRDVLPASPDRTVVCLDSAWDDIAAGQDTPVNSGVSARNLVYVMYTSGSTGRPKGVLASHRGLVNYLWWAIKGYGLESGSGAPMVGSIAFDLSVPNFFLPLIGGKAVRLLPVEDRLEALAELLAGPGDFSLLKITPGHLDVLRRLLDGRRVTSVSTFVVGADEVRPETVVGWQQIAPYARIIDEYGPTETVVGCSVHPIGEDFDPTVPVPIGMPIANLRMYVLDERFDPAPIGVPGELYIGGDGVARGYLSRPGLTAERFLPDPFAPEPGARFYRSGDLARWRCDGALEFLGRIDHQVKINGYRIELGEIEARLLAHPTVSEAVVVARAAPSGRNRLLAYLVAGPGTATDRPAARGPVAGPGPGEFADWLSRTLPGYMVPAQFVLLDRMPLTHAGKVDRAALPEPARTGRRRSQA